MKSLLHKIEVRSFVLNLDLSLKDPCVLIRLHKSEDISLDGPSSLPEVKVLSVSAHCVFDLYLKIPRFTPDSCAYIVISSNDDLEEWVECLIEQADNLDLAHVHFPPPNLLMLLLGFCI